MKIKLIGKSDGEAFKQWKIVDDAIRNNMTIQMKKLWHAEGYDGLAKVVCPHFGISKMYRGPDSYVVFEFTPHEWTVFLLKWT